MFNSANSSIADDVVVAVTFDSERYDNDTMHSVVSATDRITFTTAGKYILTAHIEWVSNATGYREMAIDDNGTIVIVS